MPIRPVSSTLIACLFLLLILPFLRRMPGPMAWWPALTALFVAFFAFVVRRAGKKSKRQTARKQADLPTGKESALPGQPEPAKPGRAPGQDGAGRSELVVIRNFIGAPSADLARMALEQAGIEAMTRKDDCGGMRPHLAVTGGVELLVRREAAPEALRVLNELEIEKG